MRRMLSLLAAALLVTPGAAVATHLGVSAAATGAQSITLKANEQAARADARSLLARVRLPPGVKRSATEPQGDSGLLRGTRSDAHLGQVVDSAWWTTRDSTQTVFDYADAHRAVTGVQPSRSVIRSPSNGNPQLWLEYSLPQVGDRLYGASLTIKIVALAGGGAGILAQSATQWVVPRAQSALVPDGVHVIDLTLRIGTGAGGMKDQRTTTHVLTRPAVVAGFVRELNALPSAQPGAAPSCVAIFPHEPQLTVLFRAGPAGPALARVQVRVSPGAHGASGWNSCDPIQLWVRGKPQTPLISTTWVNQAGRLIGVQLS